MFSFIPYLKVILENPNLSVAAEKLSISQPALSSALKKAEDQLNAPIFDRSQKPWALTEVGKLYYQQGLEYLHKVEDLKQQINDITDIKTGHLTIGGSNSFNTSYLPKVLAIFSQKYPQIDITLIDDTVPNLIDRAFRGEVDLFLTPGFPRHAQISYEKIFEEKVLLCVPNEYPINQKYKNVQIPIDIILHGRIQNEMDCIPTLRLADFEQYPFILLQESQEIGKIFRSIINKHHVVPSKTILTDQMITSLSCTNAGLGISLISETAIRCGNFKDYPTFYLLDPDISTREMYIAHFSNKYLSRAGREFIKILKETTYFND